jgi:hypothetical protein
MNIFDKISKVKQDLTNLQPVLNSIKDDLKDREKDIKVKGKTVQDANSEQPALFGYYDEIRVCVKLIHSYLEFQMIKQKAVVYKYISENSQYDYGERAKDTLISDDPKYTDLKMKQLEVEEVLLLATSICETFVQRGYSLNNITKAIVAEVQDFDINE